MSATHLKDVFRLAGLYGPSGWCFVRMRSTSIYTRSHSQLMRGKYSCLLNNAHCNRFQLHTTNTHPNGAPAIDPSVTLSPAVRYLVYTHNISDLSQLTPTGPGQRLLKGYMSRA